MEDIKKLKSGFRIINLLLLKSDFNRINDVKFDEKVKNAVDMNVNVSVNEKLITVTETVTVSQMCDEKEQVTVVVTMAGIFESEGESEIKNLKDFGSVNGASIIYPYIREHITNLTLKAGVGAIILPPVNFTKIKK